VTEPDSDELEPGALVGGEFGRLVHHSRQEAHRLHDVADAGESAAAPFIEVGAIARWLLPFVLLMIGIVLGIYFAIR
jgi:hypothetical protein